MLPKSGSKVKKEGKKAQLRLAMSEPPKKRKKSIAQGGSVSKKKVESMTALKKKSKTDVDVKRAEERPGDPISKRLFDGEDDGHDSGSSERKTTQCGAQISTPKAVEVNPKPESNRRARNLKQDEKTPAGSSKKPTRRGKKVKSPHVVASTPKADEHRNGGELNSSLDSTLPMEEDKVNSEKKRKHVEEEEEVVTFPGTPALQSLAKKQKRALDTPAVTEKTPMPTGGDQWLDSPNSDVPDGSVSGGSSDTGKRDGKGKSTKQGRRKLTAKERGRKLKENGKKKQKETLPNGDEKRPTVTKKRREKSKEDAPYVLKCVNIPRATKASYLSLFLSEMDLNPKIEIKKMRRGGGGNHRTKGIRYATITCKTKEERDQLLDLDEISLPSGDTGKEWKLRIVPQMTHRESKSNRALRILNTPDDVTEDDLKAFFAERNVRVNKAIIYRTDKAAILFLQSPMDLTRAMKSKERTLNGSKMKFFVNKGYMNFDKHGKMLMETVKDT